MAVVHGTRCGAKCLSARCRRCDSTILFFTCDCGICAAFDELGPPWAPHGCPEPWAQGLERTEHEDGSVSVRTPDGPRIVRPEKDFRVEPAFLGRARRRMDGDTFSPIVRVDAPDSGAVRVIGVVRGIAASADPFKEFNLPNTGMAMALLGERWRGQVGRVTIHSDDGETDQVESYSAWAPSALLSDGGVEAGIAASLTLSGVPMIRGGPVWFCDDLLPLT